MNWLEPVLLANAPLEIIDGDRGKNYPKQDELHDSGYCLFLSATNVTKSGFEFASCQFINEKKDDSLNKGKLQRDDVVLTTRGTLGNVAHFNDVVPYEQMRINSGMVIFRCNKNRLIPTYLYHFLRSPYFLAQVNALKSGAAQPQLPIRDIKKISIPIPPVVTQLSVINILSGYDDLIENNRRRISLLEQSARLLYREWFVYLRFPGHEHVKMVNGVPKGWRRTTVGAEAAFLGRGITPTYDDDGESTVINQKCIRDRVLSLDKARRQSKPIPKEKLVMLGDVLVNSTGEGTLGRVAQVIKNTPKCTVDSHVTIVRPSVNVGRYYFGQRLISVEELLSTMGRGATNQTELSKHDIAALDLLVPKQDLVAEFEESANLIYDQISVLIEHNKKLRETRDLLLPRLMSGEIQV